MAKWLRNDLNGDGRVTLPELKLQFGPKSRKQLRSNGILINPTSQQSDQVLEKLVAGALKADRNGDGVVSFREALEEANIATERQVDRLRNRRGRIPSSMDLNGDGTISESEFMETADQVLAAIDRNNDSRFSAREVTEFTESVRRNRNRRR